MYKIKMRLTTNCNAILRKENNATQNWNVFECDKEGTVEGTGITIIKINRHRGTITI